MSGEVLICPETSSVIQFCAGTLSDDEITRVADHLSVCPDCAQLLENRRNPELANWLAETQDEALVSVEARHQLNQNLTRLFSSANKKFPTRIGDYFVIDQIGEGGMATVYEASHPELNTNVAIKIPRPDKNFSQRIEAAFLSEARTAAKLNHTAIVKVTDFGTTESGECYVVQELIKGTSLAQIIPTVTQNFSANLKTVRTIAKALQYIHSFNLTHRDVKPDNILIDARGNAYLADFGLVFHQDDIEQFRHEFAGTLPYMSPEILRRKSLPIDGKADIWALGVVLYELLTGRKPFTGNNELEVLQAIEEGPRPIEEINPRTPTWLANICSRMLRSDLNQRIHTAKAFLKETALIKQPTARRTFVFSALGAGLFGSYAFSNFWRRPSTNFLNNPLGVVVYRPELLDFKDLSDDKLKFNARCTGDPAFFSFGAMDEDSFSAKMSVTIEPGARFGFFWGVPILAEEDSVKCNSITLIRFDSGYLIKFEEHHIEGINKNRKVTRTDSLRGGIWYTDLPSLSIEISCQANNTICIRSKNQKEIQLTDKRIRLNPRADHLFGLMVDDGSIEVKNCSIHYFKGP